MAAPAFSAVGSILLNHCTDVHFNSLFFGGFITNIVVNPPERKQVKRTSVHWLEQKTALKQGQLQEWTEHSHTAQDL